MAIALPSIAASLHSQHRTTRPLSAASVGQQGSAATDSRRSTCLPPLQRPLLLPVTLDSWTPHFCPTIAKYRSQRISARCSPTSIVVVASAKMEDDGFEDGQDGSLNPQTMKARTLELVETSMLAGLSGLVFFLASSLRLEFWKGLAILSPSLHRDPGERSLLYITAVRSHGLTLHSSNVFDLLYLYIFAAAQLCGFPAAAAHSVCHLLAPTGSNATVHSAPLAGAGSLASCSTCTCNYSSE
eukprot:TRINITY_DN767_c0_g1_i3.p1 TRINITY_DN767_c0_g1~~TRINITY_DN767_c0_g1_i3.p1  ORF type:complete len:242 (+),score=24.80 TRINITY_DN767_c0_g1_i3:70-795(+)